MQKALVTGCAGFIGSHLCERLVSENIQVVGLDSLNDYYSPRIKRANLEALLGNPSFTFIESDLLAFDLAPLVNSLDVVFHLAAQPGVRGSWGKNFSAYVDNNVMATQKLLEAAKNARGLQKLVYASSSSVYGETRVAAVNEEHPTHPQSPYGATKLAAEHLCFLYQSNYGLPVTALRLFSVYGPRQRPDMAFTRLLHAGITKKKFFLFGDGRQERDFTFVLDVVEAMILAALNNGENGVYNIGGGHVFSMKNLIETAETLLGTKILVESRKSERGDVRRTSADITKSKQVLLFQPKYGTEEGLKRQIEYIRDHLDLYEEIGTSQQ